MDYFYKKGYSTYAINLTLHDGERNPSNREINLLTFSDYVKDVKFAIDQIDEPVILVGHSMGGAIIQKYLELYPAQAAVLMATVPSNGVICATLNVLKIFPARVIRGLTSFSLYHIIRGEKHSKWAFYDNSITDEELKDYSSRVQRESFTAYMQMLFFRVKKNYHSKIPMLVLAAEGDKLFSVKEQLRTAKKYNADYKLIKNTGHNLMLTSAWRKTADTIIDWINGKINTTYYQI
jgi:alpha-beta hydrolase superfamily lysophospholipase